MDFFLDREGLASALQCRQRRLHRSGFDFARLWNDGLGRRSRLCFAVPAILSLETMFSVGELTVQISCREL